MENQTTTSNSTLDIAAALLYCQIEGDNINVSFTPNDARAETVISFSDLKSFAVNRSVNDFIRDYMHGEQVRFYTRFNLDTFLTENLNVIVKTYLQSKRVGQSVNHLIN